MVTLEKNPRDPINYYNLFVVVLGVIYLFIFIDAFINS